MYYVQSNKEEVEKEINTERRDSMKSLMAKNRDNWVSLEQESPTPRLQTGTGPQPVRNRAAQQEVSSGRVSEASSAAPHHSHYCLNQLSSRKPVPGTKEKVEASDCERLKNNVKDIGVYNVLCRGVT